MRSSPTTGSPMSTGRSRPARPSHPMAEKGVDYGAPGHAAGTRVGDPRVAACRWQRDHGRRPARRRDRCGRLLRVTDAMTSADVTAAARPTSAAAANGDPEAFEAAVRPHYAPLIRRLVLVLGDPHDAEDVAQDAYLSAFRSWDRFDGADVRAWLYTIGLRLAFNHRRGRRRWLAAIGRIEPRPWTDPRTPTCGRPLPRSTRARAPRCCSTCWTGTPRPRSPGCCRCRGDGRELDLARSIALRRELDPDR